MIEYGKYGRKESCEQLRIFWRTGKGGLPEEARLDTYGRENIPRWQSAALISGRPAGPRGVHRTGV